MVESGLQTTVNRLDQMNHRHQIPEVLVGMYKKALVWKGRANCGASNGKGITL